MTSADLRSIEAANSAELTLGRLDELRERFDARPANRLMQNAVTQVELQDVAMNRQVVTGIDHTFSHRLDDWAVTNQKKSGRCWCFAGLNLLRVNAMRQMNLQEFEFSQNYTLFWDKLERANYFLEAIVATADRALDDRTVAWLLDRPLDDGGQWNMFVNIVNKHGLVPQAVMPETESSSNTRTMNRILLAQLRQGAMRLRELATGKGSGSGNGNGSSNGNGSANGSSGRLRQAKHEILEVIYRVLSIHLGTPPGEFDWQWNDKDQQFHRDGTLTPAQFAEKYVSAPLDDYVCLVHDPRPEHPTGKTYTVEFLGNVVGGGPVCYLNVDIETMKDIARRTILDGEPVWMGCDVGQMMRRDLGLWDAGLFDYAGVYDAPFSLDKAQRLAYHQTVMTHAMLFTGVDVVEDEAGPRSRRWRVENSWGETGGRKGFYAMNDNWFDEYMFEIAARRTYLPEALQQALKQEPMVLPPWDPMGALAL